MALPELADVLEAIADVVVVVDPNGRLTMWSSATERLSGYLREELADLPVSQLLVDEHSGVRTQARNRVADGEILRREDAWLVTKQGERLPVSLSAAPVVARGADEAVTAIVIVARDTSELRELLGARDAEITRRQEAETELRRVVASIEARLDQTRAQLILAERRATLGTLAGGVGHELRNLAQIHLSSLDAIRDALAAIGGSEAANTALADLERCGDHIATHARHLLELARPGPDHVRPLNIIRVIEDVLAMLEGAGKLRHTEMVFVAPDAPILVTVNRARIEQILVNLILNATDAVAAGAAKIMVAVHPDLPHGRVGIEVSDNGTGIPPDVLPRIFEPFFTTKADHHGTGLGLPVAREIVESYAGKLAVQSSLGVGTTLTFDLPLSLAR